jgi:natural product biosynthesis luciferase-like monooxygenase protein
MEYSIFFFAADYAGSDRADPYGLFRESAVFADRAGFRTVWVPERHFHPFGGLYPSPSIMAASLTGLTQRIQLWAGSVVIPLRDPIRVAEEWAMVDLLSGGRAGLSFASGWAVNDFVLAPDAYDRRREITLERIDTIRRLWRGETVRLPNGAGKEVDLRIYPVPEREIPIALTAQSDGTAVKAAELGASLLMNMNYQGIDKLRSRIEAYRAQMARSHPGRRGHVTVLVHTLVCDREALRDVAMPAYRRYLATNLDLQLELFRGAGVDLESITPDDLEFLIARAADRMVGTVGLIGPPEECRQRAQAYEAAGVDEIACLIDFGASREATLKSLELVAEHLMR